MIPAPTWPGLADVPWPPRALLAQLDGAAELHDHAETARDCARQALTNLQDHRPGGAAFAAAAAADAAALGNPDGLRRKAPPPSEVARMIASDAVRFAVALAECGALVSRLDATRARIATTEAVAATDVLIASRDAAATHALAARDATSQSAGFARLDEYDQSVSELRQLQALRAWLVGHDAAFDPTPPARLPADVIDAATDAHEALTNVPMDERRLARIERRMAAENRNAVLQGMKPPHQELARRQFAALS